MSAKQPPANQPPANQPPANQPPANQLAANQLAAPNRPGSAGHRVVTNVYGPRVLYAHNKKKYINSMNPIV